VDEPVEEPVVASPEAVDDEEIEPEPEADAAVEADVDTVVTAAADDDDDVFEAVPVSEEVQTEDDEADAPAGEEDPAV
jgi:hypothetical protein